MHNTVTFAWISDYKYNIMQKNIYNLHESLTLYVLYDSA